MNSTPVPKHKLSKSTFMYGCQCPKRLWLYKFMPQLRDEPDEAQTAIFQRGTDVGLLAQQLFPGGVDASPANPYSYQQSVADAARYIAAGHSIIYEAAFQYQGILCAVDILVKKNDKWYAYEVKSTTSVKPPFIQDAALQFFVITNAGIALEDIFIVHLNTDYVRQGALDIVQLFSPVSVLKEVTELQTFVAQKAAELKLILTQKSTPVIEIGPQCDKPYPCDFYGHCSKDMEEEEPDYGDPFIDKDAIKSFTGSLQYPLYFMDFETWMSAVPEYDGHWSYRQVNFQFSVHILETPTADLQHHEYLAEGPHSPQLEFIENLLQVLGNEGSIVVYNKAFENTRLNELKDEFPHLEVAIIAIQDRIIDLMVPFRKKEYYLPEMLGSYSIKNVLPAVIPELSYKDLVIGNGGDASAAFYNLKNETDNEVIKITREHLLTYCKLDTFAMVKLLEKLFSI